MAFTEYDVSAAIQPDAGDPKTIILPDFTLDPALSYQVQVDFEPTPESVWGAPSPLPGIYLYAIDSNTADAYNSGSTWGQLNLHAEASGYRNQINLAIGPGINNWDTTIGAGATGFVFSAENDATITAVRARPATFATSEVELFAHDVTHHAYDPSGSGAYTGVPRGGVVGGTEAWATDDGDGSYAEIWNNALDDYTPYDLIIFTLDQLVLPLGAEWTGVKKLIVARGQQSGGLSPMLGGFGPVPPELAADPPQSLGVPIDIDQGDIYYTYRGTYQNADYFVAPAALAGNNGGGERDLLQAGQLYAMTGVMRNGPTPLRIRVTQFKIICQFTHFTEILVEEPEQLAPAIIGLAGPTRTQFYPN